MDEQLHIDDYKIEEDLSAIIEEIKGNLRYDMYELADEMIYGGFLLSAYNERGSIIFFLVTADRMYSMSFKTTLEEYKSMTPKELGSWLNECIYYTERIPEDADDSSGD